MGFGGPSLSVYTLVANRVSGVAGRMKERALATRFAARCHNSAPFLL